jgi:hypothetical protein
MTKFTIKQDQISRLRIFAQEIGKLKNISPISTRQLFYLTGADKLEVFAIGEDGSAGSIQGEIKIDITQVLDSAVSPHFETDLNSLLVVLDKISTDVEFNLTDNQLIIIGEKKSKFTITLLNGKTDDEVKEIREYIDDQLKLPEFANEIKLDITHIKPDLDNLASLTKIFDLNKLIEISETKLRTADNFGIYSQSLVTKPVLKETIHIHRDLIPLFKNINEIRISSDKKFWFFDFTSFGIRVMLVPPTSQFIYPTDKEIEDFVPTQASRIKLEVKARDFYNALAEFDGMFDTTWVYNQMYVKTASDFDTTHELILSWDDKVHQVITTLPVSVVERTDKTSDFEFIIPTKELKAIEPFFNKDDNSVFHIDYNSLNVGTQNGSGLKFYNSSVEMATPKMSV